jgi:hypothetical protein
VCRDPAHFGSDGERGDEAVITPEKPAPRCLYFGCWNEAGHYLVGPGRTRSGLANDEAWDLCSIDGRFAPRLTRDGAICFGLPYNGNSGWELNNSRECPQGQFARHRHGRWSLIQWWDRCQGDTRGACNSTILLEGEHDSAELLAALTTHFPHVLENLRRAGVELVEVKATTPGGEK